MDCWSNEGKVAHRLRVWCDLQSTNQTEERGVGEDNSIIVAPFARRLRKRQRTNSTRLSQNRPNLLSVSRLLPLHQTFYFLHEELWSYYDSWVHVSLTVNHIPNYRVSKSSWSFWHLTFLGPGFTITKSFDVAIAECGTVDLGKPWTKYVVPKIRPRVKLQVECGRSLDKEWTWTNII